MKITATQLNKRPGTYVEQAIKEDVLVEKTGRPAVVIVSYDRYLELEEAYWGNLAIESEKDELLSTEDSMRFLESNN